MQDISLVVQAFIGQPSGDAEASLQHGVFDFGKEATDIRMLVAG